MILSFSDDAWEDYLYWQQNDKKILKKINRLIKEIQREPFDGIGELNITGQATGHDVSL